MNPKPLKIAEIILLIVVVGVGAWWLMKKIPVTNPCEVRDSSDLVPAMRSQFRKDQYIDVIISFKGGSDQVEAERIEDRALAIFGKDEFILRGKGSSINPWISGRISKSGFEKVFQFEEFKSVGPNCPLQAI